MMSVLWPRRFLTTSSAGRPGHAVSSRTRRGGSRDGDPSGVISSMSTTWCGRSLMVAAGDARHVPRGLFNVGTRQGAQAFKDLIVSAYAAPRPRGPNIEYVDMARAKFRQQLSIFHGKPRSIGFTAQPGL